MGKYAGKVGDTCHTLTNVDQSFASRNVPPCQDHKILVPESLSVYHRRAAIHLKRRYILRAYTHQTEACMHDCRTEICQVSTSRATSATSRTKTFFCDVLRHTSHGRRSSNRALTRYNKLTSWPDMTGENGHSISKPRSGRDEKVRLAVNTPRFIVISGKKMACSQRKCT